MNRRKLSCFVCAFTALTGCYEPFSNDDILFLKAAPRGLEVSVPNKTGAGQALRVAQTGDDDTAARFYQDTRRAAEGVNEGVLSLLDMVDAVVAFEPTVREEDQRIWGPFPVDGGNELALVVNRTRTATVVTFTSTSAPAQADAIYDYAMLGRPIGGSDEDYVSLFAGRSLPQASNRQGTGVMIVNFDGIRMLDPSSDGQGVLFLGYDTRDGRTVVEVAADTMVSGMFEADVAWVYRLEASGAGRFNYFVREDIVETTAQRELLAIAARWMPDNRGRADVVVTQG
ncbi:unnamed protein product, partial [Laminaria digitata]